MDTLIELYDERAIENVLAADVFRPTNIFNDIISSAVVRWDEVLGHDSVINEIDVVATKGG